MSKIIAYLIAGVFGSLSKLVYYLLKLSYNLLYEIANTTLFTGTTPGSIGSFGHNIYSILGVIMMFKLAFSLLSYVINPSALDDKSKGAGSLIKNTIIVVGLILLVPIIFNQAMKLQQIILNEDILGRIITGYARPKDGSVNEKTGERLAYDIAYGFVTPNISNEDFNDTDECYVKNAKSICNMSSLNDACMDCISKFDNDARNAYVTAYNNNDTDKLFSFPVLTAVKTNNETLFTFNWLAAPVTGGFAFWIILMFCVDIAVRSIKLVFLQLISPIPIVSYIDPKGQGIFKKWVKQCTSTYIDLFVRLSAIYFAVFIIQTVINSGQLQVIKGDTYEEPSFFAKLFMMLGCLMFAKQLPNLISDITGAKLGDGKFSLNPMKKMGAGIGTAVGLGVGAVGGAAGAISASRAIGENKGRTVLNALRGGFTGAGRGTVAGFKSNGKDVYKTVSSAAGRTGNAIYNNAGTTFGARNFARFENAVGMKTGKQRMDTKIEAMKTLSSYKDKLKTQANFNTSDLNGLTYKYGSKPGDQITFESGDTVKKLKQKYDDMVSSGNCSQADIEKARTKWEYAQQAVISNNMTDSTGAIKQVDTKSLNAIKTDMAAFYKDNITDLGELRDTHGNPLKVSSNSTYSDINDAYISSQNRQIDITSSDEYRRATKVDRAIGANNKVKK